MLSLLSYPGLGVLFFELILKCMAMETTTSSLIHNKAIQGCYASCYDGRSLMEIRDRLQSGKYATVINNKVSRVDRTAQAN